jgi:hypothetical protein
MLSGIRVGKKKKRKAVEEGEESSEAAHNIQHDHEVHERKRPA